MPTALLQVVIAFARRKKWKAELLATAPTTAAQVRADAAAVDAAFDAGEFETAPGGGTAKSAKPKR